MKAKIIKVSKPTFWYVNKIGKIFEVCDDDHLFYKVLNIPNTYILREDCIIIENKVEMYDFKWKQLHNKTLKIYVGEDLTNGTDYTCITTIGVDVDTGDMYFLNNEIIK